MKIEELEALEMFEEYGLINSKELKNFPFDKDVVLIPICIDRIGEKINGIRFLTNSFMKYEDLEIKEQIIQGFTVDNLLLMNLMKVKKENKKIIEKNNSEIEFLREVVLNYSKRGV